MTDEDVVDIIIGAVWLMLRLIWPSIAILALWLAYQTAPRVAYELARGLSDQFITVYDSSQFDHTTGRWNIQTGKKEKIK